MSVSHGYSTMGGIEYDDGDCVEKTKKRKSHIDEDNQRAMEMPSIDVNMRSRDCHATDALELWMLNKIKLVGVHPTCLLTRSAGI